ncbi:MAG: M13 family metallopeptidase [Stenotrophobium sp.]
MKKLIAGIAATLLLASCAAQTPKVTTPLTEPDTVGDLLKSLRGSGIQPGNADPSVRPQDDLYRAVDGGWLKKTEIPADKSNYGAFSQLDDDAEQHLREIIEQAAAQSGKAQDSDARKIGDLYTSFMDEKRADELGVKPIRPELARIAALRGRHELPSALAVLLKNQVNSPITMNVHQDAKDPSQYIADFAQGGLGLPDRNYYLQDNAQFKAVRAKYVVHIRTMFRLAGIPHGKTAAHNIMALETKLARVQWSKVENRDADKTYNPYKTADLDGLTPGFDWTAYLKDAGLGGVQRVVISQPGFMKEFSGILRHTPMRVWREYLSWLELNDAAPFLGQALVDEDFAFNGTALNGIRENRPRWKRGVAVVDDAMGFAAGKLYVARYFPPAAKQRMDQLVQNLLAAYKVGIDQLDWMTPATKKAAQEKLAKFTPKIGYPDKWRDYTALSISSDDLYGNLQRSAEFEYQRNLNKLGKTIDRVEWQMTPQTVNAYYNPEMNEIVFPAAILQPPFFDMKADDAANYGAIGAVIGHEISHGFDDQGSKYDGDGMLRDWWTEADRKNFEARIHALIEQYNQYEPVKGYRVNGALTIGENTADLAGLTIAFRAWQMSLDGKPAPIINSLSGEQRFFEGWAQIWRRKYREENLIQRLKTDPHSPSEYRVNGVVVNIPAYYTAFDVKPGDRMYVAPDKRIKIW